MILANMSNGLIYQHDAICNFQSNHGHNCKIGYFRIDAMPLDAIVSLLKGETITILDATSHGKKLTDAFKYGVPTFCIVYNRAIRQQVEKVCEWQTKEMEHASRNEEHKKLIQTIRKLYKYFGSEKTKPAVIGENVKLVCYQHFFADDKPEVIRKLIWT